MRIFVALEIPASIQARLREAQERLLDAGWRGIRWVDPERIHLTLRFCGEMAPANVHRLRSSLSPGAPCSPFHLRVGGGGVFPPRGAPRVLWVGVGEDDRLRRLAAWVEERVVSAGLPPEDRPFRPHLTLGRVRPGRGRTRRGSARDIPASELGVMSVEHVVLFESRLDAGAPRYQPLQRFPLLGSESARDRR